MIEEIYSESAQQAQGRQAAIRIPKNIRQIGNVDEERKIYVEDYVFTYLKNYAREESSLPRAAVLLGAVAKCEQKKYFYISGAVGEERIVTADQKIRFTEEVWTSIYTQIKEYFSDLEIVGWYLSVPGFPLEISEMVQTAHLEQFAGNDKIFMMSEPLEGEEKFFSCEGGDLRPREGFYIYYEKNPQMQEFMVRCSEEGGQAGEPEGDPVTRNMRAIVSGRRESRQQQRRLAAALYSASILLVMVVVVIGITLVNNYDKMRNMETSISHISQTITAQGGQSQAGQQEGATASGQAQPSDPQTAGGTGNAAAQGAVSPKEGQAAEPQKTGGPDNTAASQAQPSDPQTTGGPDATAATQGAASLKEGQTSEPQTTGGPDNAAASQAQTPAPQTTGGIDMATASQAAAPPKEPQDSAPQEPVMSGDVQRYYTVVEGDTLIGICRKFYYSLENLNEICNVNRIENGDYIYVGQKLLIP